MTHYIALVHKENRKNYGVVFPDFPGCVAVGGSVEEALREAAEALAFHVEGMQQDGLSLPKPRSVEILRATKLDWIDWQDAIVATVPLLGAPGRTQRVQITIDERLLARIDAVTKNRSAFLADAARRELDGE
jgi:predicted RNase H-like HicB family nuclease